MILDLLINLKKYLRLKVLFSFILLNSCSEGPVCDELGPKTFRGHPQSSYEYKENCLETKHKYTPELCQLALNDLIMSGDKKIIEKKYGEGILPCFTQNDFKVFLKK